MSVSDTFIMIAISGITSAACSFFCYRIGFLDGQDSR